MIKKYPKIEDVPEAQRATAIELKDGTFAVDEPADPALGDAGKRALEAERTRAAEAEKKQREAEERAATLAREKEALSKGVTEAQLEEIRQKEALARKPIEEERDRAIAENRKLKLTDRVRALYLDPKVGGGMVDRVEDAMDQLEKRTQLGDKDGIVFKDKDGKVTADDAAAFFKAFKTEKPWLFAGPGGSGAGGGTSNGTEEPSTEKTQARTAELRSMVAGAL